MNRQPQLVLALTLILSSTIQCDAAQEYLPQTVLAQLFARDFHDFAPPSMTEAQSGISRDYTHANFDRAWNSSLLLLMQRNLVVLADRSNGLIVAFAYPPVPEYRQTDTRTRYFLDTGFPHVVLIEPIGPGETRVTVSWMEDLFREAESPDFVVIGLSDRTRRRLAESFFRTLAVELFSDRKWSYLYERNSAQTQPQESQEEPR
ncbi:MAG: hypothetical protein GY719_06285 [bacterium]|nr:hypothetical protein [bacterium]